MSLNNYPLSNVMLMMSTRESLLLDVADRMRRSSMIAEVAVHQEWVVGWTDLPGRASVPFVGEEGFAWFGEGQPVDSAQSARFVTTSLDHPTNMHALPHDAGFIALRGRRVSVVRSRRGLVPWYVMEQPDCVVVTSRNAWFPVLLPFVCEPDPLAHIGASNDGVLPDRRGFWKGTWVLRTGHRWAGGLDDRLSETCYWDPTATAPTRSVGGSRIGSSRIEEVAREVKSVLTAQLEADLDPNGANLIGLSGGVDSSCLASIATHQLQIPFHSLTLALKGDSGPISKERRYVESILRHTTPTTSWIEANTERERVEMCRDVLRLGMPIPHPALQLLPNIQSAFPTTVFSGGEMADDFFGGPQHVAYDWTSAADLPALWRAFRAPSRPISRRVLMSLAKRQVIPSPVRPALSVDYFSVASALFAPNLRAEFAEWKQRAEATYFTGEQPYGGARVALFEMDGWLLQNWEVCSALGIRRSTPFVEQQIVELACSLHPTDHAMPPKQVLRLAFQGQVPALNLLRSGKGPGFDQVGETLAVTGRDDLLGWLDPLLLNKTKGQTQLALDLAWSYEVVAASTRSVA
jgi:asparagine synthetase B (glutamine-hydrolysing)